MTSHKFKVGDQVRYATGSVEREIHFSFAVVVEVDPSKKRVGIAIRHYDTASSTSHREGGKIVTVSTFEVVWEPKRISPDSIHHVTVAEDDTSRVPSPVRTEVAIPAAWIS